MSSLNLPRLGNPRFIGFNPTTARPASFGKLYFFAAGTSQAKAAFRDRQGTVEAPNPVELDAGGGADVFLSGPYRIELRDANDAFLWEADQINSITVELESGNPGSLIAANNLTDLADVAVAREALGLRLQDTPTDATADRVLKNGSWGLGRVQSIATPSDDLDAITYSGLSYEVGAATANRPASDGIVAHFARAADRAWQLFARATGSAAGDLRWRERSGDGWSAWFSIWHSGNRRSNTDDDGRFLRISQLFAEITATADKLTARTNLGLGTASTLAAGTGTGDVRTNAQNDGHFLKRASNLSDVSNASVARVNLGLGSAAQRAVGTSGADIRDNTANDAHFYRKGTDDVVAADLATGGAESFWVASRLVDRAYNAIGQTALLRVSNDQPNVNPGDILDASVGLSYVAAGGEVSATTVPAGSKWRAHGFCRPSDDFHGNRVTLFMRTE